MTPDHPDIYLQIPYILEHSNKDYGNILSERVHNRNLRRILAGGGFAMETYVILGKYTEKGAANIKESPARIQAARKAVEAAGGKWLGWYLTMGQYDMVVITEAPSAQVVASVVLAIGSQGNVSTQTLRAFTEEEFKGLLASLP